MRWDDFRRSDNVDDAGSGGGFGLGGGVRLGGGALIAVVVISLLLGKNPLDVLTLLSRARRPRCRRPHPAWRRADPVRRQPTIRNAISCARS